MGLRLTKDYSCELESGNTFDCTVLKDGEWHYVVLRRDSYTTLTTLIDGVTKAMWRNSGVTIGRVLSIGK